MEFRILGRLTVLESNQEVALGGDRQRQVLAALLASRAARVSAERLIDELWGENPPATASTSLQVAVGKLRRAIGADAIKTVGGGYLLDVSDTEVDAGRFEATVVDARESLRRGDAERAARLFNEALILWRGAAFEDVAFGESTTAEAARLNELRLGAVEDYVDAKLSLGDHSALVPELTELIAAHPYRERLHRHLIVALYRSGRQAEALAAYTALRVLLVEELGVDPSPDLAALERRILDQDPGLDAPKRSFRDGLPTGDVTLLLSDIAGSTAMAHRLGDDWSLVLSRHQELSRAAWSDNGGIEIGTDSDSSFVAFPSAQQAVLAAIEVQQAVVTSEWPGNEQVRVRIGIHTGSPRRHDDGYVGIDVQVAARIAAATHGGQVVVSEATAALVERVLPDGFVLRDLGAHRLKDIPGRFRLDQLVFPGVERLFPPLRTQGSSRNLPVPMTEMVGREGELAELRTTVENGARLITLTGPGGSGKTRLAIGLAVETAHRFTDGVYFVALAAVTTSDAMWTTMAQVLEVPPEGNIPPGFFDHVVNRHLLVILDNLEQCDGADHVVHDLLTAAAHITVVATSRRPLHIDGEHEHQVPPLLLPASASYDAVRNSGAVAMFVQHAQHVRRGFALSQDNAAEVATLCRALDGLPLALELAAARTKLLSPKAILGRLDQILDITSDRGETPDRQRSLRAAVEWSYELLSPNLQRLLDHLAVFAGGADLAGIEAVAPTEDLNGGGLLDLLFDLVDASLLTVTDTSDGEPRFILLETIRMFALDRLTRNGELDVACRRHAQHYYESGLSLLHAFVTGRRAEAVDRFVRELGNFRVALARSPEGLFDPGTRSANAADAVTDFRLNAVFTECSINAAHLHEAMTWTRAAAERPPDITDLPAFAGYTECLRNLAHAHLFRNDVEEASAAARRCTEMTQDLLTEAQARGADLPCWFDPVKNFAMTAVMKGHIQRFAGDLAGARALAQQVLDFGQALSPTRKIEALALLFALDDEAGDFDRALGILEQIDTIAESTGNIGQLAHSVGERIELEISRGELDTARDLLRSSVDFMIAQDPTDICYCAEAFAFVEGATHPELSARTLGAAANFRVVEGRPMHPVAARELDEHVDRIKSGLPAATWEAAFNRGRGESIINLLHELQALP